MKRTIFLVACMLSFSMISCKKNSLEASVAKDDSSASTLTEAPAYSKFGMEDTDVPYGLKKGDKAPSIEVLVNGVKTPLSTLYKDQTVALFFYRGNWCPVCNKHLADFTERARDLTAKGIRLVAVTPEDADGIDKMKEKTGANFTIISDLDGSIQKAFDVDYVVTSSYAKKIEDKLGASIADNNASREAVLPVPATYVIDRTGEIIYSHFDVNYKNRASVDDILSSVH